MNAAGRFVPTGILVTLGCLSLGMAGVARADSAPATRAARLSYMQGAVTVESPSSGENVQAQLNMPLLTGAQIITGGDGQAEVEFEDGSVVRLTPNSALSLDNLSVQADGVFLTNLSLLHGLAYCELRAAPQFRYSISAGGDVLSPVENTTVRVDYDEPPAAFSVFDGTAQVERQGTDALTSGYETQVRAGETLRADAANGNRYSVTQQIAADSWDQWNDDMDQAAAAEAANSTTVRNGYAGEDGYGWADLDANGDWYDVPGQGPVWQPYAAADDASFDPYGFGAWVWYPGVGYLWSSGYGWGWTPYRCGNWSYWSGFGWGWMPGAGCGGFGWGLFGAGHPVNIAAGPSGYRPIRVPSGVSRPVHPVLPVHTTTITAHPAPVEPAPRQIAGVTATPIKPAGNGLLSGGGTAGASLWRDYPVDPVSHATVMGLASTSPTVVHTTSQSYRPMLPVPAATGGTVQGQPAYTPPAKAGAQQAVRPAQPRPGTTYTPQPARGASTPPRSMPQVQRTAPPSRPAYMPAPRMSMPSPPPAPRAAPAPSSSRPR